MRRISLAALVVAATVFAPAQAGAKSRDHDPCNTHACHVRVAHKQSKAKKLRVIAPYRAWLGMVRRCESGGNYGIANGNGFYGAYQFTLTTWWAAGGRGMPHLNPPLEQDYRAVIWRLKIGNPHTTAGWPVCG
jgi:hypothetical protein